MAASYNATAYSFEGEVLVSVEAIRVEDGVVVRGCGLWSHRSGSPAYEADWLAGTPSFVDGICIVEDGARGYRDRIAGLALGLADGGRS